MLLFHILLQTTPDWTQLSAVLLWLASSGGAVMAINWIIANFLEKMAWWGALPTWVKWVVPPLVAIAVSIGAQQVVQIPGLVDLIQPYWALIISILLGYFASQAAHLQTKRAMALKKSNQG